jgi:ribokinase
MGVHGSTFYDGRHNMMVPSLTVNAVDTTGAGDVFQGALIHGLLAEWSCVRALSFASAAAGLACETYGACCKGLDIGAIEHGAASLRPLVVAPKPR